MDFKVNREIISACEEIYNGTCEQSVELDHILPDYYPDIFKLVKCTLSPKVIASSVNGEKVSFELSVDVRIWYCSEQSPVMQSITQKLNYTKSLDLGRSCENAVLKIKPYTDYVNCRAVNQRRLDIRGAVSCKVTVVCEQKQETVCDAFGMNIQLKKKQVVTTSGRLNATKNVAVEEDVDLGLSKPPVLNIIRSDVAISNIDKKIIANKLVAKGEGVVSVLYSADNGSGGLESMQFTLPFSQVIDMDGIDETYDCIIEAEPVNCDVNAAANSDGESKLLKCSILIALNCSAIRPQNIEVVTDAYSTSYPCDYAVSKAKLEGMPSKINEIYSAKETLEYNNSEIECIYDAWCSADSITSRCSGESGNLIITGKLHWSAIIKGEGGRPALLEKDTVLEYTTEMNECTQYSRSDINACVAACSYTLSSANTVTIKAEIKLYGSVYSVISCDFITDIAVDGNALKKRDGDYALKLYFAGEGEDIWDIAKKYSTSVNAIMEENELEDEDRVKAGMLLIPIVAG